MRRRGAVPAWEEPPGYLLRLDPERYRHVAEDALRRGRWSPTGDTFTVGMRVWHAWREERREWCRARGIDGWHERRELLGAIGPAPFGWVAKTFGLPPYPRAEDGPPPYLAP